MMPVAVMNQALFVQPNNNPRDENPLQPDGTNASNNLMEPFPVTI